VGIGVYTVKGENVNWVAIITGYFRKKTLRKQEINYRKLKYIFCACLNGYVNMPSAFNLGKSPYITVFI